MLQTSAGLSSVSLPARYGVNIAASDFFTAGLSGVACSLVKKPASLAQARIASFANLLEISCRKYTNRQILIIHYYV